MSWCQDSVYVNFSIAFAVTFCYAWLVYAQGTSCSSVVTHLVPVLLEDGSVHRGKAVCMELGVPRESLEFHFNSSEMFWGVVRFILPHFICNINLYLYYIIYNQARLIKWLYAVIRKMVGKSELAIPWSALACEWETCCHLMDIVWFLWNL